MKHVWIALAAAFTVSLASAQARDASKYFTDECIAGAVRKEESPNYAKRACLCMFEVLARGMTLAEYIEFENLHASGRAPYSHPAAVRLRPQIQQCRRATR